MCRVAGRCQSGAGEEEHRQNITFFFSHIWPIPTQFTLPHTYLPLTLPFPTPNLTEPHTLSSPASRNPQLLPNFTQPHTLPQPHAAPSPTPHPHATPSSSPYSPAAEPLDYMRRAGRQHAWHVRQLTELAIDYLCRCRLPSQSSRLISLPPSSLSLSILLTIIHFSLSLTDILPSSLLLVTPFLPSSSANFSYILSLYPFTNPSFISLPHLLLLWLSV